MESARDDRSRVKPTRDKLDSSKNPFEIIKAAGMLFGNLNHVTFDPEIDCPPYACYNCWSMSHISKDCYEPKTREYCCNCGRKDVKVIHCPRCSRAFHEQDPNRKLWIWRTFSRFDNREGDQDSNYDKNSSFYSCLDNGPISAVMDINKTVTDFDSESPPAYTEPNDLFAFMRVRKTAEVYPNDGVNLDETRMAERNSFGENSMMSDECHLEEDTMKEQKSSQPSSQLLHDLLNLLNAVKHLSVCAQEVVVLQFVAEREKLTPE